MNKRLPKIYLYRRIVHAKIFIDENFDSKIDVVKISDKACFSKFHFIRQFRSVYRVTPHQYLIAVRIKNAMGLLRQNIPVNETCMAVGFESVSSFCGLFKRITGTSPAEYQSHCMERYKKIASSPRSFIPGCFAVKNGW